MNGAFGKFIEQKRKAMGMTLRGLAAEWGIAPAFMSDIEKGHRYPPNRDKLYELARILKLNAEDKDTMFDLAAGRAGTDAGMQTQGSVDSMAYIEETLESFKASVRAEMDKELEERIKWISLGAGIGAGNAVGTVAGGVGVMAEGLQQTDRANVAQTSSGMTEGGIGGDYPADEDYSSEKSYDDDFGFDDEDSGTLFEDDSEYESGVQFEDEAEEESDIEFEDDGSEDDELLDSMAEEYADMDLEQKMEDIGELVIEVTLEELAAYVKKNRKK